MLRASAIIKAFQVFIFLGVCFGLGNVTAQAQIQVAGDLFVDLSAANFDPATGLWSQSAACTTCLGDFMAVGDPLKVTTAEGVTAIEFDGGPDYFDGPAPAPGLVGPSPTRSIEVWAFNPAIASEETLVSWGRRGGPEGSNMAFNYGNNPMYGAVGHWGGATADKGWNNDDATTGAPAGGAWHHLAYTFDGTTTRVYADGALVGTEDVFTSHGITVDTHVTDTGGNPLPIRIASQNDDNGAATAGLRGSLSIGAVRVHDGVLSDLEILTNYLIEQPNYMNPAPPEPEFHNIAPKHRYSFSEPAMGDAAGQTVIDSIGGADGVVRGAGSSSSGESLKLNGGPSDSAAYVDLPNGIISALTDATVEGWFTLDGSQTWSRVFDFGSSQAGEPGGPGGSGEGLDYLMLSAQIGTDTNAQRYEINNRDPVGGTGGEGVVDAAGEGLGQEYHFAAVFDSDGNAGSPRATIYINGENRGEFNPGAQLNQINDVNNWLGRSNWTGDSNTDGTYNEFRIYDVALTHNQILGNLDRGPDVIPEPGAFIMLLFALSALMMRWDKRRQMHN